MSKKKYRRQGGSAPVASHSVPVADSAAADAAKSDGEISVEEARRMLGDAARFLHDALKLARKALDGVDVEQLQKQAQGEPQPADPQPADQRKRPRGSRPIALVLLGLGNSAARLLKQVMRVLQPELFGAKPPKKSDWLDAAAKASMAEMLGKKLAAIRA
ncbi:MAG: hypothetical protein KDB82_03220 [Planctomycetes bacterium]|nr:hypothetical protein [Planctomycetota bacterium]